MVKEREYITQLENFIPLFNLVLSNNKLWVMFTNFSNVAVILLCHPPQLEEKNRFWNNSLVMDDLVSLLFLYRVYDNFAVLMLVHLFTN